MTIYVEITSLTFAGVSAAARLARPVHHGGRPSGHGYRRWEEGRIGCHRVDSFGRPL